MEGAVRNRTRLWPRLAALGMSSPCGVGLVAQRASSGSAPAPRFWPTSRWAHRTTSPLLDPADTERGRRALDGWGGGATDAGPSLQKGLGIVSISRAEMDAVMNNHFRLEAAEE